METDEHGRPFAQGGITRGLPRPMLLRDFFEYVGEHLIYADGSMKRWTGEALVPCTGCDYSDHRIGAQAYADAQRPT